MTPSLTPTPMQKAANTNYKINGKVIKMGWGCQNLLPCSSGKPYCVAGEQITQHIMLPPLTCKREMILVQPLLLRHRLRLLRLKDSDTGVTKSQMYTQPFSLTSVFTDMQGEE